MRKGIANDPLRLGRWTPLVEGWWIYQSWNADKPLDRDMVVNAVNALASASGHQLIE